MKKYTYIVSALIILGAIYWSFYALMPQHFTKENTPLDKFAAERALIHVKAIAKHPHYLGTPNHEEVQRYIINELKKLGLDVETQEGYVLDKWKTLSKPKNILARIKGTGNGEALVLLAHYDSSPHSSFGASDDACGVATILEGVRAFKTSRLTPKNDIIILISDAEEVGLSGAELFVKKHPWAKQVKLVLNFEARGSRGPSYMLIETNEGNASMINAFKKADISFPVANSLVYSIYKMLPNDTDLTIFKKEGGINGFNFAFIDDHFNYHTARDNYENLGRNSLEHQGTYLMPLLHYFAYYNLNEVKSTEDHVYFNSPLGFHHYSSVWIFPLLIVAFAVFGFLIYTGFKNKRLTAKSIFLGFIPFIIALIVTTLTAYYGWEVLLNLYPHYEEMLHGFTYNGYLYIAAFSCLTVSICFIIYSFFKTKDRLANYAVAPLFIWLIINLAVAVYLKGGSFFIIPVYVALLLFYLAIKNHKNSILLSFLSLPILLLLTPFIQMFPVGLGLNMMMASAVFIVLMFGLLLVVFGSYPFKRIVALLCFIAFGFFVITAHFKSNFNENRQKPNSLVYIFNADENKSYWATYDTMLDSWTSKKLGAHPKEASTLNKNILPSKYGTPFRYVAETSNVRILPPKIEISKDTIMGNSRHIELCITPQRAVNKIEIFADNRAAITTLFANGEKLRQTKYNKANKSSRQFLLSYQLTHGEPLELHFTIPKNEKVTFEINEASFDLLDNQLLNISPRSKEMIPKPFVLNDAVMIKKTIHL
jgi:Peptidase family M28